MNKKSTGDLATNCIIGDLSKYGLGIAFPLSDNYPFDLIVIANNKLFKVQVKSSSRIINDGSIFFSHVKTNELKNDYYSSDEVDVFALYNLINNETYLFNFSSISNKSGVSIRLKPPKNNQCNCIYSYDVILSKKRIKDVFKFETPNFEESYSKFGTERYEHRCLICNTLFKSTLKEAKYCSHRCRGVSLRSKKYPSAEELKIDIDLMSMEEIGKKYNVSGVTIKKWSKQHKII